MKTRLLAALGLVVLAVGLTGGAASAATGGTITSVNFQCDHVTIAYDTVAFDRDNTSKGQEAWVLIVKDGNGQTLFQDAGSPAVGTSLPGDNAVITYGTTPTANPISVQLISLAGNGFDQQLIWNVAGSPQCTYPTTTTATTAPPKSSTTTTTVAESTTATLPTGSTTPGTTPPPTVFATSTTTTTTTVEATSTTEEELTSEGPTTTVTGGPDIVTSAGPGTPGPSVAGSSGGAEATGLARTGVELAPVAILGLLLAATGTILLLVKRRTV